MEYLGFTVRFVLAVLATWRVTHLLAAEDGPGDIIVRIRAKLGNSFAGKLMDCFYCLSIWIAAPAAVFAARKPLDWLMTWLAVSGAACLLERATQKPASAQPDYQLLPGGTDHVLRTETSSTLGQSFGIEHTEVSGRYASSAAKGPEPSAGLDADSAEHDSPLVSANDWGRASAPDSGSAPAASGSYRDGYR